MASPENGHYRSSSPVYYYRVNIQVFEFVNIRTGPKNGFTPECEARGC